MSTDRALMTASLPPGVVLHPLSVHPDNRGVLSEIYRKEWRGCDAVQFNCVSNVANVLRGVHVHVEHDDHLVMIKGSMLLGLHDLRPWSADFGRSCMRRLEESAPVVAMIPPGVAHGFYFESPAILVYGTSTYWDPADELGCRWDAPELGFHWGTRNPVLSTRDSNAGSHAQMTERFLAGWNARQRKLVTA